MKFPLLLSALFCMGWTTSAQAEERSLEDMRIAAQQALQHKGFARVRATEQAAIADIQLFDANSQTAVLGYTDGGFAIISRDDQLPAVMAYCEGSYEKAKLNPSFSNYLNTFNGYLDYCAAEGIAPRFIQHAATFNPEGVKEIMTCKWDQGGPYNYICPFVYKADKDGVLDDRRCITGCVATAMAQILYTLHKKHGADIKLRGAKHYYYIDDNKRLAFETANLASIPLEWDKMLDTYTASTGHLQNLAVARLMYACGVASEMMYSTGASGTYTSIANEGLNDFFEGIKAEYSGYGIGEDWEQRIYDEFDAGRPVMLSGANDQNGGHCFVGDGYDKEGRIHINLGWSGGGNGFFTIADMAGFSQAQTVNAILPEDNDELHLTNDAPIDELKGKYITADVNHPAEAISQDQWYVLYNKGRYSSAYSTGLGKKIQNSSYIPITDEAEKAACMIVRFIPKAGSSNAYFIQTGTGDYFGGLDYGTNYGSESQPSFPYTTGHIQQKKAKTYFWFKQNNTVLDCNAPGGQGIAGWGTTTPTDTLGHACWQLLPVTLSDTPEMPHFNKCNFDPTHRYVLLSSDGTKNFYFNAKTTCSISKSSATELKFTPYGEGWKITAATDENQVVSLKDKDFKLGNGSGNQDIPVTFFFEPTNEPVDTGDEDLDACSRYYRIRCESGYLGTQKLAIGSPAYSNLGPNAPYGRWLIIDQTDLDEIRRLNAIEDVTIDTPAHSAATYDLQGRKVTAPQTDGRTRVYIKEGRKEIR